MSRTEVILVDEQDRPVGKAEKMKAHREGLLHRAFSVFIFNDKGEMLLQQRAAHKYHSGGLWTNACCSHPAPGETTAAAASRRLQEEMGFSTALTKIFDFTYRAEFDNGLTEHEYDHVYIGNYDGTILAHEAEVKDHCFMSIQMITDMMQLHPEKYTSWFKIAFPMLKLFLAAFKK